MELYFRKICLRHLQYIIGICKKYIPIFLIFCHKLIFPFFEILQSLGIITLYPASFIKADRFPFTLRSIFM